MRKGIYNDEQMRLLTRVLMEHCTERAIIPGSAAEEDTARRIMRLYMSGLHTAEQLRKALLVDGYRSPDEAPVPTFGSSST
jgi:hypothetical protein